MLNKKGEKLLSIWWFFVIAVVGAGITAGVLIYYSASVDMRGAEAELLSEKIFDCVVEEGFLIEGLLEESFDVFEECKLKEEVFEDGSFFYFHIRIFDEAGDLIKVFDESGDLVREEIKEGDVSFEDDCEIQEEDEEGKKVRAKYYPKCVRKKKIIWYYSNGIKEGELEILTASNQVGGKIPTPLE